jgi:hypothetical protein
MGRWEGGDIGMEGLTRLHVGVDSLSRNEDLRLEEIFSRC